MHPIARKRAREYALQALYQLELSGDDIHAIEKDYLERQINKKIDVDYFKELIHKISENKLALDSHFQPFSNIKHEEIDLIELMILRMGTYELAHRLDVPYRVVINEGLELSKRFGSIEGYKFVNGILDQVARQLRQVEIKK